MHDDLNFLPPHEPTTVPGFHAYSHRVSVVPGESIDVRVSADGKVKAEAMRLGIDPISRTRSEPAGARLVADLGFFPSQPHNIYRGSYVYVDNPVALQPPWAVELWVRPLAAGCVAGLISRNAYQLSIAKDGRPVFEMGNRPNTTRLTGPPLTTKRWHHIVAQCHGRSAQLYVDAQRVGACDVPDSLPVDNSPLRIGALSNAKGEAACLLTGDICGLSLYRRKFPQEEIDRRYINRVTDPAPGCVGHWKFDSLYGAPYRDTSESGTHGKGVNYPLRMIPGPRLTEEQSWVEHDPTADPHFGYAVRFMADQLIDCRWPETLRWDVPRNTAPGQYAIRLIDESGQSRFVPFIVRSPHPTSQMMCLSTTNTRIAYNYKSFDNPDVDYGAYLHHPVYPMMGHLLGQRRPTTGPDYLFTVVNLELPFYRWLNRQGIEYDLYSEWDLAADPSLLDHYSIVAWAGHSEYWTQERFEGLQRFRRRGGHILSLSGNTAFWRVNIDAENGLIEVRKHGDAAAAKHGGTVDSMVNNAHWHQMDNQPGTTMHACGWPAFQLGLGSTNGWTEPCDIDGPRASYEVITPDHRLFHEPRIIRTEVPLAEGGAGYETDISLSSMIERFGGPRRAYIPPRNTSSDLEFVACLTNDYTILARARIEGDHELFDYDLSHTTGELWSEMHIWEPTGEGITFAAGSCMAALALEDDENFSNFLLNVLDRMNLTSAELTCPHE